MTLDPNVIEAQGTLLVRKLEAALGTIAKGDFGPLAKALRNVAKDATDFADQLEGVEPDEAEQPDAEADEAASEAENTEAAGSAEGQDDGDTPAAPPASHDDLLAQISALIESKLEAAGLGKATKEAKTPAKKTGGSTTRRPAAAPPPAPRDPAAGNGTGGAPFKWPTNLAEGLD